MHEWGNHSLRALLCSSSFHTIDLDSSKLLLEHPVVPVSLPSRRQLSTYLFESLHVSCLLPLPADVLIRTYIHQRSEENRRLSQNEGSANYWLFTLINSGEGSFGGGIYLRTWQLISKPSFVHLQAISGKMAVRGDNNFESNSIIVGHLGRRKSSINSLHSQARQDFFNPNPESEDYFGVDMFESHYFLPNALC